MYKTKCPVCGAEELYVVHLVWDGEARLYEDGFEILSGDTTDEIVRCKECEAEFALSELMEE